MYVCWGRCRKAHCCGAKLCCGKAIIAAIAWWLATGRAFLGTLSGAGCATVTFVPFVLAPIFSLRAEGGV